MNRIKKIIGRLVCILVMVQCVFTGCTDGKISREENSNNDKTNEKTEAESDINSGDIVFENSEVIADAEKVTTEDGKVTITGGGIYRVSGQSEDGQIYIDAGKEDEVILVLDGLHLSCKNNAPVKIMKAGKVTVTLEENTGNFLADAVDYDTEENEDAVIFSKCDMTFTGTGSLTISANYKHGIVCKDSMLVENGIYNITAKKDGINVNDELVINGGAFTISAEDDGISCDELLTINNGDINIEESYEGLEGHKVVINDGSINIKASDDGINSNSGSDKNSLQPGSNDKGGMKQGDMPNPEDMPQQGDVPNPEDMPQQGDMPNPEDMPQHMDGKGGPDMDSDEDSLIEINGGNIVVDAAGDGLDSNGYLKITGGTIYVSGAENDGNAAIDYSIRANITGGEIMATGYSGMAQGFDDNSGQPYLLCRLDEAAAADSDIKLCDKDGKEIYSMKTMKSCNCIVYSGEELIKGEQYTIIYNETQIECTAIN